MLCLYVIIKWLCEYLRHGSDSLDHGIALSTLPSRRQEGENHFIQPWFKTWTSSDRTLICPRFVCAHNGWYWHKVHVNLDTSHCPALEALTDIQITFSAVSQQHFFQGFQMSSCQGMVSLIALGTDLQIFFIRKLGSMSAKCNSW